VPHRIAAETRLHSNIRPGSGRRERGVEREDQERGRKGCRYEARDHPRTVAVTDGEVRESWKMRPPQLRSYATDTPQEAVKARPELLRILETCI
jgi:hypothetical protein